MVTTVRHLHETLVRVTRESDGASFQFQTYRLRGDEWGYELVSAMGHPTSSISDPDWSSEAKVIEAIHDHAEKMEHVPGWGWCVRSSEETAVRGMTR